MYKTDTHLHTVFSPDGHQTPEELIAAAAAAGLSEITVTDHCECNDNGAIPPDEMPWGPLDIKAYTEAFERLKDTSPVKLGIGVEIGQATQNPAFARKATAAYEWDYIIGSLHNIRNEYDFCYLKYGTRDLKPLFTAYFEQLYELVLFGGFSSLGHLYYPVRYLSRQGITLDFSQFDTLINDIFKELAVRGMGLEINTSGIFEKFGDFIPGSKYVKMFREAGGEIITVGSDGHYAERVGRGVEAAHEMLREAGVKYIATFEKMKPVFHTV